MTRTEFDELRAAVRSNDLGYIRSHVAINNNSKRQDELEARINTLEGVLPLIVALDDRVQELEDRLALVLTLFEERLAHFEERLAHQQPLDIDNGCEVRNASPVQQRE